MKGNEISRTYSTHGEMRNAYKMLFGKYEVKKLLGRPRRKWEGNIEIYLKNVGFEGCTGLNWVRIGSSGGLL
jgi:hypothetical protein